MALSSRDVMFALRAQDFASRRINAVGGAFNRLAKEIAASQKRIDQATARANDQLQRQIAPLTRVNETLRQANVEDKARVASIRDSTRATQRSMAASRDYTNSQIAGLRGVIGAERERMQAAQASNQALAAGLRAQNSAIRSQIAPLKESRQLHSDNLRLYQNEVNSIQSASRIRLDSMRAENLLTRQTLEMNRQMVRTGRDSMGQFVSQKGLEDARKAIAAGQHQNKVQRQLIESERIRAGQQARFAEEQVKVAQTSLRAHDKRIAQLREEMAVSRTRADQSRAINDREIARRRSLIQENERLVAQEQRRSGIAQRRMQQTVRNNQAEIDGLNRNIRTREAQMAQNTQLARQYETAAARQVAAVQRVEQAEQARLQRIQASSQRMMMGGAAMTVGGMITAAIGGAVISQLNQATRAAAEFQHGIALARTQIDELGRAAGASIGTLTDVVLRVGREVPASMEEMPQTLFFIFTALNASVSEAEDLLKGFAQEAVAGNASIEASARSTIAIINGMNYSVDELTRVQDFQFQTVRKGVITYEELSANIGKVIPPLRRMGQEVEVGGAMLAFLTRQGLSAEMAATSAARSLELFSDPRVISRLEGMGVSMRDDVSGEFEHFGVIINDLADQFDGLTGPQRAEQMREIFGGAGFRIQARRFLDTVFASEESLKHFNEQIEWAEDNTGAFARAFENMSQEPANRLQDLANQFFTLRHELGVGMLPILEQVVDKFRQVADWFANIDEGTRANIAQWAAYGAAALLVVGGLTAIVGIMITIAGMLTMLTKSIGMAIGITLGFVPVVTALGVAFGLLMMHGFDVGAMLDTLGLNFDTNAGQARVLAIALGAVTASLIVAKAVGLGYLGMLGAMTTAIAAKAKAAVALSKALWLIIATNPIIAMFAALTALSVGLAIAFSRTTREARELQAATDRQTDAHIDQIDTISSSIEGFENYNNHMKEASKIAAEQTLAERDLEGALERSKLTRYEYLNAVAEGGDVHERAVETLSKEIEAQKESLSWSDRYLMNGILIRSANNKELDQKEALLEALEQEIPARKTAEQSMRDEMRARGGMSAMIAQYLSMAEREGPLAEHNTAKMREQIIATLDAQGVLGDMNDEQVENLFNSENLAEAVEELTSAYANLGAELASVLTDIRNPATALSEALESINEAGSAAAEGTDEAFESFESLIEASGGAEQAASNWLEVLREQEQETTDLFGNMSAVYDKHEDSIVRNADGSIEAILALGEAGPEAMEILASASPEQFVEILHHIRTQAAMASEDVQNNIGLMFNRIKSMQDDYQNVSEQQWTDIMMGMSLIIADHGEDAVEHMPRLMAMMAQHIEDGGEINATEIANMMADFFHIIDSGAGEILEYWPGVHDELGKILRDKGIENADVFDSVMDDLERIASHGGERAVEALRQKLADGTGGVARVARAYADILAGNLNAILGTLGEPTIVLQGYDVGQFHNKGGFVPGSGPDRDSVIAGLTPGEFVLRRKAVEKMDPHVLDHLNRTGDISAVAGMYNAGGWVTPDQLPKPPGAGAYSPRVSPLIEPAQATTKKMYDESKSWVAEQVPPLGPGIGYQAMWKAVSQVFPWARLTSGYRPGAITATGNPSYHGMGRAVDLGGRGFMDTAGMGQIARWIAQNYKSQTRELIYSGVGAPQVHNGRSHYYTGVTRRNHYDHVHWAMANGGIINEPVLGTGLRSGQSYAFGENGPETVIPGDLRSGTRVTSGSGSGGGGGTSTSFPGGIGDPFALMQQASDTFYGIAIRATDSMNESINTMISGINAMKAYEGAQNALKDARENVVDLKDNLVGLRIEAVQVERQLEAAIKRSQEVTAEQELAIINARRQVRDSQFTLEGMENGIHSLNNELSVLQQELRVEEMRKAFEEMQDGPGEPEGLQEQVAAVQDAQAAYTKAKFELERIKDVLPTMDNEVDKLLLQFKAENELADASKNLTEQQKALQDMQSKTGKSATELRIAEIELALAEEELRKRQEARKHEGEELREAQLNLKTAQEGLTQAVKDSTAPTQEVIDLQNRLREIQQEREQSLQELEMAQRRVGEAELDLMTSSLGLIRAGQEMVEMGEYELKFFRNLANAVGVSTDSIRELQKAKEELQTMSGSGAVKNMFEEADVSLNYGGREGETAGERMERIAEEISSGQRTTEQLQGALETLSYREQLDKMYVQVREVFRKYNLPYTYGAQQGEDGRARITRLAEEVLDPSGRTFNQISGAIKRLAEKAGTFDMGGILPPGLTLALNKTGSNEHVLTGKQFESLISGGPTRGSSRGSGNTLTIERGAVNVTIEGDAEDGVEQKIQEALQEVFDEMITQFRSN